MISRIAILDRATTTFFKEVGGGAIMGMVVGASVGITITTYLQSQVDVPLSLPHDGAHTVFMKTEAANYTVIPIFTAVGGVCGTAYGIIRLCFIRQEPEQRLPR